MPVYVYRCDNCGREVERYQHFTDDPITVCPECKQVGLQKVWQPTEFILRGEGWYKTDAKTRG